MKKFFIFLLMVLFLVEPVLAEEISTSTVNLEASTSTKSNTEAITTTRELILEPNIRVGLFKTKEKLRFQSDFNYQIINDDGQVNILPQGEVAEMNYNNGIYQLKSDSLDLESDKFWRLEPFDRESTFSLPDCKRTYTGRKKFYCDYRGTLEFRYSPKSKMPYIINELPLDDYIKGIAETDNNSTEGYIKAVLVAARSYAYFNISKDPPTEKRMFDVYATTQDQLYLGYTSEKLMPRVAQFATDTYGEMVTYNSKPVVTPYFSRSNGFTKDWKNSKGINDRPWLKKAECIYDKGKRQYGHGIGMSTHDALMRATKDDWGYIQLLQHYYTDTQVEKIY